MVLSPAEVEQFYRIWFPLLHFANQKLKVVKSFPSVWGDDSVDTQDAAKIRIALWEDETNTILDNFIQQNPHKLDDEDLEVVKQWKHRVSGAFFMFRYLKKYTIFLTEGSPDRAYGVYGILSSFEEMFGNNLPLYVNTTLIPFNGKIIYDSLIAPYPVIFGGGVKSSLNETYRYIQEREGIVEMLPFHEDDISSEQVAKSNKKVIKAFEKHLGKSGVSPKKTIEHTDNIEHLADYLAQAQSSSKFLIDIDQPLIETYIRQTKGKINLVSLRRFARFLRDTYRIYYEDAEDILNALKKK